MITIGPGHKLNIELVRAIAVERAPVALAPATHDMLAERRRQIVEFVTRTGIPAYGFNRGFGHNVGTAVPADKLADLQRNLIRSHASGLGDPAPVPVVRAAMVLRAHSLAQGASGIRPVVVETLVAWLNNDITPIVPRFGSVGASGDLAPLSHIARALLGEGSVIHNEQIVPAASALSAAGISPLVLEMKEGLALNNGVQFSTAWGLMSLIECENLLRTAAIATALSTQVLLGADTPFAPELHALRPHPGAVAVAGWITALMANSPLRELHREAADDNRVQDPYSLRCSAQILGTVHDLLSEARRTFEIEINSVTDNPLLLSQPTDAGATFTRIVSGGHFHGMPVAVKLYNLMQSLAIMASLSNTRCARFVDEARNVGLGSDLIWTLLDPGDRATSSGMMLAEYASAALTNFIWGAAMPSHLFSIATDAGQEDHVSMSAGLAVRVAETIPRLAEAIGIELAFAAQAAAIRTASSALPIGPRGHLPVPPECRTLSAISEQILSEIRTVFPTVTNDRPLGDELSAVAEKVRRGDFVRLVPATMWDSTSASALEAKSHDALQN
jgi:histidine ammonia-lyase